VYVELAGRQRLKSGTPSDEMSGPREILKRADRRLFTLVGCIDRSVVCAQILRLWRAGGAADVDIVPGEHFPQEDPAAAVAQKITNLQPARPAP
jgi:hypothetical protein